MDRDDIIKMAKEAGIEFYPSPTNDVRFCLFKNLERFATLVAAAVAEPEQEPVAWANESDLPNFDMKVRTGPDLHHTVPLYTAPSKQWVGLTEREVELIDEMIETQLLHAERCDHMANSTMAQKQKAWDLERVELLRKLKEKNT